MLPDGWTPRRTTLVVLAIIALGAILRFYAIGSQPLSLDEAESLRFARESFPALWSWGTIADPGNPPLYYSLLKAWLVLGQSEANLRFLPAAFGVLTIPLVYVLGRIMRDPVLGMVAAFLFAVSPFQVRYSQDSRAYTLLALGTTLALVGTAYLVRYPRRSSARLPGASTLAWWKARRERAGQRLAPTVDFAWLAYIVGSVVALLAHNTAVFLLAAVNILMVGRWLILRSKLSGFIRNWLVAQFAILVLWGAWLPAFFKQLHMGAVDWLARPSVGTVLRSAYDIYAGTSRGVPVIVGVVILLPLVVIGLWSWRGDRRWIAFILIFGLAAPSGELLISVWKPVYLERTLIWAGVPLCLSIAAGVLSLRRTAYVAVALAILTLFASVQLVSFYDQPPTEAWDQVAAYVSQREKPGDVIVFLASFVQTPFDYYYTAPPFSVDQVGIERGKASDTALSEATTHQRVWLVLSHTNGVRHHVLTTLDDLGRVIDSAKFPGIQIYLISPAS